MGTGGAVCGVGEHFSSSLPSGSCRNWAPSWAQRWASRPVGKFAFRLWEMVDLFLEMAHPCVWADARVQQRRPEDTVGRTGKPEAMTQTTTKS